MGSNYIRSGPSGLFTLGKLINDHPGIVPKPLDVAIDKLWGYTSNMGRHLKEESPPDFDEAELAVSISDSVIAYLAKKNFRDSGPYVAFRADDDFEF